MKRIKDRPMTPLLKLQQEEQVRRIKLCGIVARTSHIRQSANSEGTFYSERFK